MALSRHVFYAGQLHAVYTLAEWIQGNYFEEVPDGAYLLMSEGTRWYLRQSASFNPLDIAEVPAELKTLCLLLGIQFQ